jgi:intraflagellar transport protein 172
VASRSSAAEAAALKRRLYQWLLETGQDEEAGRVKERDGDFVGAISLFLKGGLPGKAAQVNAAMHVYCAPHWCDGLEWCRRWQVFGYM